MVSFSVSKYAVVLYVQHECAGQWGDHVLGGAEQDRTR